MNEAIPSAYAVVWTGGKKKVRPSQHNDRVSFESRPPNPNTLTFGLSILLRNGAISTYTVLNICSAVVEFAVGGQETRLPAHVLIPNRVDRLGQGESSDCHDDCKKRSSPVAKDGHGGATVLCGNQLR